MAAERDRGGDWFRFRCVFQGLTLTPGAVAIRQASSQHQRFIVVGDPSRLFLSRHSHSTTPPRCQRDGRTLRQNMAVAERLGMAIATCWLNETNSREWTVGEVIRFTREGAGVHRCVPAPSSPLGQHAAERRDAPNTLEAPRAGCVCGARNQQEDGLGDAPLLSGRFQSTAAPEEVSQFPTI